MPCFERRRSLQRLTVCALFAALTCVLSPISLPIGPIPVSLGLLGVLLTAVCLPPVLSLTSVAVYVAIGLCGLPVFGGALGGAMVLVGPTGGYLWAYLPVAAVVSLLKNGKSTVFKRQALRAFFACLCGVLICYACGTLQYILLTGTPVLSALSVCVIPFLPFDLLKAILAALLGVRLSALLAKSR